MIFTIFSIRMINTIFKKLIDKSYPFPPRTIHDGLPSLWPDLCTKKLKASLSLSSFSSQFTSFYSPLPTPQFCILLSFCWALSWFFPSALYPTPIVLNLSFVVNLLIFVMIPPYFHLHHLLVVLVNLCWVLAILLCTIFSLAHILAYPLSLLVLSNPSWHLYN
jgi:hypothetical protein